MKNYLLSLTLSLSAAALIFSGRFVAAQTDYCKDLATKVLTDLKPLDILDQNVIQGMANDPSCFVQANLEDAAIKAIAPVRTSLWNAFQSFSSSQQQGSSLSSSGSTNAVSKPSGQTSVVEEFGGANVTRGTSSTTVQWAPGSAAGKGYVEEQVDTLTSTGSSTDKTKQIGAQAKSQAQNNAQPGSLTFTGTADIYNSEPPSSVPSGSHLRDIQAGAEFAWVFSPFGKNSALGNFLGSVTTSAAYSYEDQTSPAILTGPALSDFTGLPSSTTAVYAKRGVIHLGQIRLGFGTGKNLTYPLAFTYSNRTELITHPTWGLQFGISYNLTSLFNSSGTTKSGNGN